LRKARIKTAIGSLLYAFKSKHVNWGKSVAMLRECGSDALPIDGVLVVVRGRESLPHGEGEQFKKFV
jgi:hypothetical protein